MAKPYKIPKKIAGLRIPRSIRKSKILLNFLQNPQNRQLATNMVMAAGGAMATILAQHRPSTEQVKHAAQGVGEVGSTATGLVADTVNRVAHSLVSSLSASRESKKKEDSHKKFEETPDLGSEKPH
ncbi:hypothetical protein [Geminicoccus flavidas]|uniref:hypothetical protein n=1 Tax=Geminicoccus flavidas TaxID=2506407 RepID=UPI00135BF988|nr:hypothetical protein [Geminicoccus flavidas]